jgi:hypothetical protein
VPEHFDEALGLDDAFATMKAGEVARSIVSF